MPKRTTIALLAAGGIFLWGCSKTQDTAPETRIFGQPPVIQSVTLDSGASSGSASCDFTDYLKTFLCQGGLPPDQIVAPFPTISINVAYTEARFQVKVTDPENSTPDSDILLVSASYKTTTGSKPTEISLVILDDGSSNTFNFAQQGTEAENCDPTQCSCTGATYLLTSNDAVALDETFTRGFAIVSNNLRLTSPVNVAVGNKSDFARNCIARAKHQFPAFVDVPLNSSIPFKIEAVDKEGNLTTWPAQPSATFNQTTFSCTGDDCGCCLMLSSNPSVDCHARNGMIGIPGSGFEGGFCNTVF